MAKTLIFHLGYHKTGSSSIQKWLRDSAGALDGHLACYNLVDGSSNPPKFAAHAFVMGQGGLDDLAGRCREMRDEIAARPEPVVCYTDEGLLGLPLGFRVGAFTETRIYPRAREIIAVLAREFTAFSPVFVVFERQSEPWLRSVHNQMFKQGCFPGGFEAYLARFRPRVDWPALRGELSAGIAGIAGNGRLVACDFEAEFARPLAEMTLIRLLDIPPGRLANCPPELARINPSVPLPPGPPPPRRRWLPWAGRTR